MSEKSPPPIQERTRKMVLQWIDQINKGDRTAPRIVKCIQCHAVPIDWSEMQSEFGPHFDEFEFRAREIRYPDGRSEYIAEDQYGRQIE